MRPTVLFALLASVASGACASTQGSAPPQPGTQETVRIANSGANTTFDMQTVSDNAPIVKAEIFRPIGDVWSALQVVYDSLGITIASRDEATHMLGNPALKVRRRLGSVRLAQYVDCGSTQGAPSADSYEVVLSVFTAAQPTATGTTIVTQVSGQGRPVAFSGEYVRCASTGQLERQIANRVKLRVK
jgi:hypothetical protein